MKILLVEDHTPTASYIVKGLNEAGINAKTAADGKTDRLRSCRGCVADCARITEDFLFKGEFEPYEERRADEE